jgi:hypothetical protein
VSRLFRSRLRIGMSPGRLRLVAERRGWRRTDVDTAVIPVEAGKGLADWRPAIEALPSAMAHARMQGPEVSIVLSNHFVRYALLPANDALKKDAEWRAFARHRLSGIHGPVSDDWLVRVSAAQPGGVRIVSASDSALIEDIRGRVAEAGGMLVSAQPNLIAAFNRARERIGTDSCWLVIRETGRLTMALLENGTWKALRTRRVDDDVNLSLQEVLERECALLALPEPCTRSVVYVHEDFAIDGGEPMRVDDWQLTGSDAFALGDDTDAPGGLRSKAPERPLAPVDTRP